MNKTHPHILILAGEASGDMHAANLIKILHAKNPHIRFSGMGGTQMQKAGANIIQDCADLSLVGLTEVLLNFHLIISAFQKLKKFMQNSKPDLVILIDYPGFNLRFAKTAKQMGLKVFYYISPQLWAWHQSRVKKIKQSVDVMAVVFPFEVDFYRQHHIEAKFVGHPLITTVKRDFTLAAAKEYFTFNAHHPVVGILPGSRKGEIKRLLPIFVTAAEAIKKSIPAVQFILPLAPSIKPEDVEIYLRHCSFTIKIVTQQTYKAIQACDVVMIASGTATLETALLEVPMAMAYKVSRLNGFVGKRVIKVPFLGICNIIVKREIIKEFIQENATSENMAKEIIHLLKDMNYWKAQQKELVAIKKMLDNDKKSDISELVLNAL